MSHIDPVSLRLFVTVAGQGTIAAAAAQHNIAAAAVSKRISDLEAELGTPLLTRTNKGIKVTAAGIELLALAQSALHELDQIAVQMSSHSRGVRGLVRICTSTSALAQFLPERINEILFQHPGIKVHFQEEISSEVPRAILGNAADIGIFTDDVDDFSLETFPCYQDRLVLIAPRDHALAGRGTVGFAETLAYDYVGFDRDSAIRKRVIRAAETERQQMKVRIAVRTFEALSMMVSSGYCLGILPKVIAKRNMKIFDYALVELSDDWAVRQFRIGVRSQKALPSAASIVLDHLRQTAER